MATASHTAPFADLPSCLSLLEQRLSHVLPAQAPIRDFVHHNTLHGFQHLPFPDAIRAARDLTGAQGYLPQQRFRELYDAGRITRADLLDALASLARVDLDEVIAATPARRITRRDILLVALLQPPRRLSQTELVFEIEERAALETFQPGIDEIAQARILDDQDATAPKALRGLWQSCLDVLGLSHASLHPEELHALTADQLDALAADDSVPAPELHAVPRGIRREARELLKSLFARLGNEWSMRSFLQALTGEDVLDEVRPTLIRHIGAHLDQGVAAWHNPARERGFYAAWHASAVHDPSWRIGDLPEWGSHLERLPMEPVAAIEQELRLLGLPEDRWPGYLERLALEIPGWSGMALWRSNHPGYDGSNWPIAMTDFLAVRLVLERLYTQRLCRRHWQLEASMPMLRWYFTRHPAELVCRFSLFSSRLPEHLVAIGQRLVQEALQDKPEIVAAGWVKFARLLTAWRAAPAPDRLTGVSVAGTAWPLYCFVQCLGLSARDVHSLGRNGSSELLRVASSIDAEEAGHLWLRAYERHYREQIFVALTANHGRARVEQRPPAQLVYCMDDREEGMRRHVEETNPAVETFGAAGFFGVAINWRGLDDTTVTPLCPIVVTPAHEVREVEQPGLELMRAKHAHRRALRMRWRERLFHGTRHALLRSGLLLPLAAPLAAFALPAKLIGPRHLGRLLSRWRTVVDLNVPTRLMLSAPPASPPATPAAPRLGFTDSEQADRVEGFLRTIGLTNHFAPLVVLFGHGSSSANNPHLAAYDCGACSGRHGGPNARVFAAMANRSQVRALLVQRGLAIPESTWFIGAEHNTCDDATTFFDEDTLPASHRVRLASLKTDLNTAAQAHAAERCRRFASAPRNPGDARAARHVRDRLYDFSQPRPELGHVTNAVAFIGRRSMTRGAFFDRRAFLISYDPTQDPEGSILEAILLAAGPVGAGISLEYYFSTVNNDHYGCGTKTVHNLTGLFGVMEGASSDLRTGLPRQMVEIHEAMRLLIVLEHRTDVITRLYERQPALKELIGNGWVVVAAKDPDSPMIHLFDPASGWRLWSGSTSSIAHVTRSRDWFAGHEGPLPPALLTAVIADGARRT